MLSATQKNAIRKTAKNEFNIKGSTWINVFPVVDNQYLVTYIDRISHKERREMLIFEG